MESLEGRRFGPYPLRVSRERVDEFIDATRDDPGRWPDHAPPGWVACCLFTVAPRLLGSPQIQGRGVVHGEQRFWWRGSTDIESVLSVSGLVTRIRSRAGVDLVGLDLAVEAADQPLMGGASTFLVSGEAAAGGQSQEEAEPRPEASAENDPLGTGAELKAIRRSASRSDLVRYAAATRDWNPIHWDHDTAVEAGLPGVVVHGLLQAAWLMSAAARLRPQPAPLAEAGFRFRAPLRPNVQSAVTLAVEGDSLQARLVAGETETVAARMVLR